MLSKSRLFSSATLRLVVVLERTTGAIGLSGGRHLMRRSKNTNLGLCWKSFSSSSSAIDYSNSHSDETSSNNNTLSPPSSSSSNLIPQTPSEASEIVTFPASNSSSRGTTPTTTKTSTITTEKPVLLNSKEHVVGYLSKILSARVYDVAVETELQHAKNLSEVCVCVCV